MILLLPLPPAAAKCLGYSVHYAHQMSHTELSQHFLAPTGFPINHCFPLQVLYLRLLYIFLYSCRNQKGLDIASVGGQGVQNGDVFSPCKLLHTLLRMWGTYVELEPHSRITICFPHPRPRHEVPLAPVPSLSCHDTAKLNKLATAPWTPYFSQLSKI